MKSPPASLLAYCLHAHASVCLMATPVTVWKPGPEFDVPRCFHMIMHVIDLVSFLGQGGPVPRYTAWCELHNFRKVGLSSEHANVPCRGAATQKAECSAIDASAQTRSIAAEGLSSA